MAEQKKEESSRAPLMDGPGDASRREFVQQALLVTAGAALTGFIPQLKTVLAEGAACTPNVGLEVTNPGEIRSGSNGLLQAVLRVRGENRQVSYLDVIGQPSNPQPTCGSFLLRAYEGYSGTKVDKAKLVTKPGVYGPGPTFRASVGDTIQIALLNHVDPQQFPETANETCDVVINATTGQQIYPGVAPHPPIPDKFPDCFRGSNTTNLHFHGTHVSPNAFSDNVLVEVVPDLKAVPEECAHLFPIACKDYPNPRAWKYQDATTEKELTDFIQQRAINGLEQLDQTQPEKNDPDLHRRQAAHNRTLQEYDEFPQYWAGCFPYCIKPPQYVPPAAGGTPKYVMGQSPGTHWYHAHKHGSTAIQVFNGMAGALILEGDYDKVLRATMPGIQERVLVVQQFQVQPNRERTGGPAGTGAGGAANNPGLLVNGQLQPVITMKTGEVQWWRLINASVQGGKDAKFLAGFVGTAAPTAFQTAQDGVQFAWQNYYRQLPSPGGNQPQTTFIFAPGNRMDLLVKAPDSPGTASFMFIPPQGKPAAAQNNILTIKTVAPTDGLAYNQKYPQTVNQYPVLPEFLSDITEVSECRYIKYQMGGPGSPPMINGRTFQQNVIDEAMLLETKQEWTIENYSTDPPPSAPGVGPRHPFHIHVNPFQIIEIFDPTEMTQPLKLPQPWIWWDTFALPVAKGSTPGYIKMRTHFADFAGKFVNHCHILAHEDRGMMQLIEVVDNKTKVSHH